MNPKALAFAVVGALVGALAWGGIAAATGYEIGWIAWGIGALVGFGGHLGESEGQSAGVTCGALAVAAILIGKVFAVQFGAPGEIRKFAEASLNEAVYEEIMTDARDYAEVADGGDVAGYMVSHGYAEVDSADEVGFDEKYDFENGRGQELLRFAADEPGFEEWREAEIEMLTAQFLGSYSFTERIKDSLSMFDILFILLGVSTAYKLGAAEN